MRLERIWGCSISSQRHRRRPTLCQKGWGLQVPRPPPSTLAQPSHLGIRGLAKATLLTFPTKLALSLPSAGSLSSLSIAV